MAGRGQLEPKVMTGPKGSLAPIAAARRTWLNSSGRSLEDRDGEILDIKRHRHCERSDAISYPSCSTHRIASSLRSSQRPPRLGLLNLPTGMPASHSVLDRQRETFAAPPCFGPLKNATFVLQVNGAAV